MNALGVQKYEDLIVWQKAMDLVAEVYKIAKLLPGEELYALSDQMRRAAVSIPSNIAEGNSRHTTQDYVRFLGIARGSKAEVETQLEICIRLNYITKDQTLSALALCNEIGKMLSSIIQRLGNRD